MVMPDRRVEGGHLGNSGLERKEEHMVFDKGRVELRDAGKLSLCFAALTCAALVGATMLGAGSPPSAEYSGSSPRQAGTGSGSYAFRRGGGGNQGRFPERDSGKGLDVRKR